MSAELILPLDARDASVVVAGGKGANLARLVRAGFPVPPGFVVTTAAYHAFVATNGLGAVIADALGRLPADDPASLEAAAEALRARFTTGALPPELADKVRTAYAALGRPPVAVRSSATAEDLPDLSFAGLQDTYLQVVGDEALLRSIVSCMASLWTARAIGYRSRNGVPHQEAALAVVVQEMVPSEVAGVLFTADPLSGKRDTVVIDAALGLGETLVAGRVEPDHYVVDAVGRIAGKMLGAKALSLRGQSGGGTIAVAEEAAGRQALPDAAIGELAALGRQAAHLFGVPQDVEWAWAGGRFWLLQSRPITSLYPLPEGLPAEPLQVLVSFGTLQGVLDPLTPLGRDVLRALCAAWGTRLRVHVTYETQKMMLVAGERLFVNLTSTVRSRLVRRLGPDMWRLADPGLARALEGLRDDPRLAPEPLRIPWDRLRPVARLAVPLLGRMLLLLLWPDRGRVLGLRRTEAALARATARSTAATTLGQRVRLLERLLDHVMVTMPVQLLPAVQVGAASFYLLHRLAAGVLGGKTVALEMTRGLPHNPTTIMDLTLWETARTIRADPASAAALTAAPAGALAADSLAGRLPEVAQAAVAGFLDRYGMRGLAEIDLGRPRWREDPTAVLQALQSYLAITDPEQAPDRVFARGAAAAEAAVTRLADAVRRTRWGWLKARLVRGAARRLRALAGLREAPKFFMIRLFGLLRAGLLDCGRQLADAGVLDRPDDLFFLHLGELSALAAATPRAWRALVADRRQAYWRELRRRQIPRLLLSDGQAFYQGADTPAEAGGRVLIGSPVSPGVAEGVVRVIRDPAGARLTPGEVLVCPGTDPSWTPLFLAAGALVTEVGGLITHGAVVAREYGIPAVVGVSQATARLRTGQRVRVDGSSGQITLLDEAP
jgi:phosphohistidine swiveling domain-containing protein